MVFLSDTTDVFRIFIGHYSSKNQLRTILKDLKCFAKNCRIIGLDGRTWDDLPDNTAKVKARWVLSIAGW